MRPVQLTLAGLQSYREKQEVDFTRLADAGVFGIFGPTGSGKSSILDAMTLALYGKVERAPGGTQGIINQMETACSVAFTFELNGAGGAERYRVERQYKRTGDVSVNQSLSRLIRLEGEEASVIADKAKDVDNKIQEILGLSMQDFTRAVVLPQGKFAEFLSLKGVERRHMLERLFHLEQYGEALASKVSARVRETDMEVKRAEAEQLGLGDASEAALKESQVKLAAAEAAFNAQRELLQTAEREAEEKRNLWKLIRERTALEAEEKRLAGSQPQMEELRTKLRLSAQAARLEHFLTEWELAVKSMAAADTRLAEAQGAYDQTAEACTRQEVTYRETQLRLEQETGPLQAALEALKRALELHGELRSATQGIMERLEREAALKTMLQASADAAAKEQQLLDKAAALQAELKLKLAGLELPPGRREKLQAARLAAERLAGLGSQQAEAAAARAAAELELAPLRADSAALLQKESELGAVVLELNRQGGRLRSKLEEAAIAADSLLKTVREGESAAQLLQQEAYRHSLAANLARELLEGCPCPVCGSPEHPLPADASHQPEADYGPLQGQWKDLGADLASRSSSIRQLQAALTADYSRLRQDGGWAAADVQEQSFLEAAAGVVEAEGIASGPVDAARLESMRSLLAVQIQRLGETAFMLEGELKTWSRKLRESEAEQRSLESRRTELAARLAATERSLESAESRHNQLLQQLTVQREEWRQLYPDLPLDSVGDEWNRLQEILKEQEELRGRLDKAEPYMASQLDKLNRLKEEGNRLEKDFIQVQTERQGMESLAQEKRSRLESLLKEPLTEAAAEARFTALSDQLVKLRESEASARKRLEELQQELLRCSSILSAAKEAREAAAGLLARAEANGRRELSEAGFTSGEEARAALLKAEEALRMEEQLRIYEEQLLDLRSRLSQLAVQLNGRSVTEEEWSRSEAALASERQKDEENVRLKAKAERDLEELQSKHERWKLLEQERKGAQELLDRLQKLQTVLRGNAFVEFMAEEQLSQVSRAASERLGQLTRRRYALETDSTGGFIIRDDANGGLKRPVSTLSGGETFLTSLSLALALSAQIQLNGKYPLEFFFLDEGFGTLDPDLLETVVHALEKLHMEQLTVGVISHVPELKARLPRRLVVLPADSAGQGSRIQFEML